MEKVILHIPKISTKFRVAPQCFCENQNSVQTDRQTGGSFFCLFCLLRHTKHEHSSKGVNFFFHSCDYNTFSFYILRMWWENENWHAKFLYANLAHDFRFFFVSCFERDLIENKKEKQKVLGATVIWAPKTPYIWSRKSGTCLLHKCMSLL